MTTGTLLTSLVGFGGVLLHLELTPRLVPVKWANLCGAGASSGGRDLGAFDVLI